MGVLMGYCNDPATVRVDFFKESGKWYTIGGSVVGCGMPIVGSDNV